MTLRIGEALLDRIRRHGEEAYPAECCGVIAGTADPVKQAVRVVPGANRRTDDPHRYLMDAEQIRLVERELRATGLEIVGYYHSHPDHPAAPSPYDAEHAWPWYSYLIVQVAAGRAAEITAWVLDAERPIMHRESLEVPTEV
ncbi:MAG: M67 family metallopeptidase [Gemmatimonadales bacterium]